MVESWETNCTWGRAHPLIGHVSKVPLQYDTFTASTPHTDYFYTIHSLHHLQHVSSTTCISLHCHHTITASTSYHHRIFLKSLESVVLCRAPNPDDFSIVTISPRHVHCIHAVRKLSSTIQQHDSNLGSIPLPLPHFPRHPRVQTGLKRHRTGRIRGWLFLWPAYPPPLSVV